MAQNQQLSLFGQYVTVNTASGTVSIANTLAVTTVSANGTLGTSGQALTTNGSAVYWSTIVGTNTAAQYTWSNTQTFSNTITFSQVINGTANNANNLGGQLPAYYTNATNITTGTLPYAQLGVNVVNSTGSFTISGVYTHNANIVLTTPLISNGGSGTSGQVLTSNGTTGSPYWAAAAAGVNTAAQYTWSNTQSFTNTITFSGNVVISTTITANASVGTAGQVLTSGASGNVYWSTVSGGGVNLASSYAFTNVTASANATSGAITTAGGLGVANNLYVGGRVGFANTTSSVVYQIYNATTGSLDTVFG